MRRRDKQLSDPNHFERRYSYLFIYDQFCENVLIYLVSHSYHIINWIAALLYSISSKWSLNVCLVIGSFS